MSGQEPTQSNDALSVDSILGQQGRLAARLANYEARPQQLQMAHAVAQALADQKHLVAEAGTGTGKSFAYLVPAILYATDPRRESTRRVIVSTHTISLQEQLIGKDLPLLNSVIPREFTAVLAKGRGNYVSLRRLQRAVSRSGALFQDQEHFRQLDHLRRWAGETTDGSLSDLPTRPSADVWSEVASDASNCQGRQCPRFKDCFYQRARQRARGAQIVVVNHALFFTDLALRQQNAQILPDYDAVVFDEAHTMEAVASDHLGLRVSSGQLDYILRRLYNVRTDKGLLVGIANRRTLQQVDGVRDAAEEFFADWQEWFEQQGPRFNGRVNTPQAIQGRLSGELNQLAADLERLGKSIDQREPRQDVLAAAERVEGLSMAIDSWQQQRETETVYWVEVQAARRNRPRVQLAASPIDVGAALQRQLFQPTKSVILTSATLSTGRPPSFEFFQSRVGLSGNRSLAVGSPFDYSRQAKAIVVRGMPDPAREAPEYERLCAAMVERYASRTAGRVFVLFTSYGLLRGVQQRIMPWVRAEGYSLYSQADGMNRTEMLDRFKEDSRAILLGTESFWQGVDVPGDALQNVIITKLPFSVPDHPLLQARLEAIRQRGGNPFQEYQLPEAIIKLRQGFGRLIRTRQDTGIVVLLDPRITTRPYGGQFLRSLPDCLVVQEDAQ